MTASRQRSSRSFFSTVLALIIIAASFAIFPTQYTQPGQMIIRADEKQVPVAESVPSRGSASESRAADDAAIPRDTPSRRTLIIPYFPVPAEAERRLQSALKVQVTVNFVETPLIDALDFLAEQAELSIRIDRRAFEDAGHSGDEPVTLVHAGISAESALKLLLDEMKMAFVIQNDVLTVTTRDKATEKQIVRVYPVGDLLIPAEQETWDELTESIRLSLPDVLWQDIAGTGGTISTVKAVDAIVVRQTRSAHDQILGLLESLRAAHLSAQAD